MSIVWIYNRKLAVSKSYRAQLSSSTENYTLNNQGLSVQQVNIFNENHLRDNR